MDDEPDNFLKTDFDLKNISKKIRSSARAKDISDRSKLSSADPNVLEEHDQFWKDHKLLLQLFIFLGVMPVTRKTGRIAFSWISFSTIYAAVFYLFTTTIVLFVGYERLKILIYSSKKFDEYIYSILFLMYLVPHFLTPFTGWGVAREVVVYKNSWTHFQVGAIHYPFLPLHIFFSVEILSSYWKILGVSKIEPIDYFD